MVPIITLKFEFSVFGKFFFKSHILMFHFLIVSADLSFPSFFMGVGVFISKITTQNFSNQYLHAHLLEALTPDSEFVSNNICLIRSYLELTS